MSGPRRSFARFPKTRWSLVAQATDRQLSERALDEICRLYWQPLYAYIRRCGYDVADAEDLTQGFLSRFCARKNWAVADKTKGRLRSFLLTDLKLYLSDHIKHRQALKRGGGMINLSIDGEFVEEQLRDHRASPDASFERVWVITLLRTVFDTLETDSKSEKEERLFHDLKAALWAGSGKSLAEIARDHEVPEVNVRVMAYRLRKRYRLALEAEVRDTLTESDQVDEEIQYLFRILNQV